MFCRSILLNFKLAHFGGGIVFNNLKAFSRFSNIHPGSFFFEEINFITSSGNYDVDIFLGTGDDGEGNAVEIFQVRANPNGRAYAPTGSAVMGCFNPVTSTSEVFEWSAKQDDKGPRPDSDVRAC